MFISTTTLTSSPSDLTAVGQKQEACSSIGLLARQSPSDRPLTTPSSTTLSMAIRQPNWSEADTLFACNDHIVYSADEHLHQFPLHAVDFCGEPVVACFPLTRVHGVAGLRLGLLNRPVRSLALFVPASNDRNP